MQKGLVIKEAWAICKKTFKALERMVAPWFDSLSAACIFFYRLAIIERFIARLHQQPIISQARGLHIDRNNFIDMLRL